ncbi:MAG: GMC family oxidoreductase N-terminal domain-containing protein, partial [Bdellovibrionales bacterium]|nr:GMC family oxidoreductase N-terminal domain-containing protein [Bdellovibrionales bacterium]
MKQPLSRRRLLKNTLRTAGLGIGIQVIRRPAHASEGNSGEDANKWRYVRPAYTYLADVPQRLFQAKSFDTIVIGSGYGGSVLAARLKAKFPHKTLALLEKGKEWAPGDYPKSLMQAAREMTMTNPLGLYEFHMLKDLDIFQGSGLGGTSLVNANVAIEPDAEMWAQEEWP